MRSLRRPCLRRIVAGIAASACAVALGTASAPPVAARAADLWFLQDGQGLFASNFGSSGVVYISGVQIGGFFPASDVYVTPNGNWSTRDGSALVDISNPQGIPNTVVGFEVVQIPIFLPTLPVGAYDVVIDAGQDGIYDDAFDQVIGFDAAPGLTVFFDGTIGAIDKQRLKDEMAEPWRDAAAKASALASMIQVFEVADGVLGQTKVITGGYAVYDSVLVPSTADALVSFTNSTVELASAEMIDNAFDGTAILREAAADLASAADGIAADPPDSNFRVVAPYVPPTIVHDELAAEPFGAIAKSANRLREAAAQADALLHAVERFDGAVLAEQWGWARMQAAGIDAHAAQLAQRLAAVDSASAALASAIAPFEGETTLGSEVGAVVATLRRIRASGLTHGERFGFLEGGLTVAEVSALQEQLRTIPIDGLEGDLTSDLVAFDAPAASAALGDLSVQAANQVVATDTTAVAVHWTHAEVARLQFLLSVYGYDSVDELAKAGVYVLAFIDAIAPSPAPTPAILDPAGTDVTRRISWSGDDLTVLDRVKTRWEVNDEDAHRLGFYLLSFIAALGG